MRLGVAGERRGGGGCQRRYGLSSCMADEALSRIIRKEERRMQTADGGWEEGGTCGEKKGGHAPHSWQAVKKEKRK